MAIILIIAAIAIPNLLRARMAANEASAVASVRTINSAEITYNSTCPTIGFSANLKNMGGAIGTPCAPGPTSACLIDAVLTNNGNPANSGKSGYKFRTGAGTQAGTVYVGTRLLRLRSPSTRPVSARSARKKMLWFVSTRPALAPTRKRAS